MFTQCYIFVKDSEQKKINMSNQFLTGVSNRKADLKMWPSAQNKQWVILVLLMVKVLTKMSSFPFNSRVQYVLGPLPSTRVCLQVILFSVSHVARLCGQLQSNGSLTTQPFENEHLYVQYTVKTKSSFQGRTFKWFSEEFFCPFAFELRSPVKVKGS